MGGVAALNSAEFFQLAGFENYWQITFLILGIIIIGCNIGLLFVNEPQPDDRRESQQQTDKMIEEKFFHSKTAIITLFAACFVVLISLGVRQVFGLFFIDFNQSLNISNTAFGFAIGIQMLMWGLTGPIFGAIADRYGGHVAIISAFIFYTAGIFFLYTGPNTGIFFRSIWVY